MLTLNKTMSTYKPGDWNCEQCRYINFASRITCRGCGEYRVNRGVNNNDWVCPNCKDLQFARNTICRKCSYSRTGVKPNIPKKIGDWICALCGDHQFAKNVICRSCKSPKSSSQNINIQRVPIPQSVPSAPSEKDVIANEDENEDVCVVCMDAPKEIGFLHTSSDSAYVHTCCCSTCAKMIMQNTKKCPMCNEISSTTVITYNA